MYFKEIEIGLISSFLYWNKVLNNMSLVNIWHFFIFKVFVTVNTWYENIHSIFWNESLWITPFLCGSSKWHSNAIWSLLKIWNRKRSLLLLQITALHCQNLKHIFSQKYRRIKILLRLKVCIFQISKDI